VARDYNDYLEFTQSIDEYALELKGLIPATMSAFGGLARAASTSGALDRKTKELMALAIAVADRCDGCIGYHARGALRFGASRQEVAETLGVAVMMGGGPSVDFAADALRAYDQFRAATAAGESSMS
jgi:AhpD family alkylhydroperoxidase